MLDSALDGGWDAGVFRGGGVDTDQRRRADVSGFGEAVCGEKIAPLVRGMDEAQQMDAGVVKQLFALG